MAIQSTPDLNYSGQNVAVDGVKVTYDSMLNTKIASASAPGFYTGTGAPTFSANKGSLYTNLTGSTTATRLYVNNGTTTWIAVTTAS